MAKISRRDLARMDFESLAQSESFLRVLFTILETSGMLTGNFHSDGRIHAWSEGRRSLGLDILRSAEQVLGPLALSRILEAETKTQLEVNHDNRNDYRKQRRRELDGDDHGDGDGGDDRGHDRGHDVGLRYLDYSVRD
jgi:hypothetical protein